MFMAPHEQTWSKLSRSCTRMARTIWPMVYRRTLTSNVWRPIGGYEWTESVLIGSHLYHFPLYFEYIDENISIESLIRSPEEDAYILRKLYIYIGIYKRGVGGGVEGSWGGAGTTVQGMRTWIANACFITSTAPFRFFSLTEGRPLADNKADPSTAR